MRKSLIFLLALLLLAGCHPTSLSDERPYDVNDNFLLTADHLLLQRMQPLHNQPVDTLMGFTMLQRGDALVVAQVMVIPEDETDSVWVKVAHDQQTMGWIHENELLRSVVPDEPISRCIHFLARHHQLCLCLLSALCVVGCVWRWKKNLPLRLPLITDLPSLYPTVLVMSVSASALLFSALDKSAPHLWAQYYYHPTLNPFEWPLLLGAFLCVLWVSLILFVASWSVAFHLLPAGQSLLFVLVLAAEAMCAFLLFRAISPLWLSVVCFLVASAWTVRRYFRRFHAPFACGKCGSPLHQLGRCPHCGALNE